MYIIIYNAETDFVQVEEKGKLQREVEDLLKEGYAQDDIFLYEATPIYFSVELEAKVTLDK